MQPFIISDLAIFILNILAFKHHCLAYSTPKTYYPFQKMNGSTEGCSTWSMEESPIE